MWDRFFPREKLTEIFTALSTGILCLRRDNDSAFWQRPFRCSFLRRLTAMPLAIKVSTAAIAIREISENGIFACRTPNFDAPSQFGGWRNFRLMPRTLVLTRNKVVPSPLARSARDLKARGGRWRIGRRLPWRFEDISTVAAATF